MVKYKRSILLAILLLFISLIAAYSGKSPNNKFSEDDGANGSSKKPSQKVILKADDFAMQSSVSDWLKFFDFLKENDLLASIGVLGKPLSKKSKEELTEMRTLFEKNKNSIELWNHGWSHWSKSTGYEFRGPSKEKQKRSLRKTQDLVKDVFGITMTTFGAGNNRTDQNTFIALNEIAEIQIVFNYSVLNNPETDLHLLNFSEIIGYEWPEKISFDRFVDTYHKKLSQNPYLVLQIHPASPWDKQSWDEFQKIIDFLKNKNSTFVTAEKYIQSL